MWYVDWYMLIDIFWYQVDMDSSLSHRPGWSRCVCAATLTLQAGVSTHEARLCRPRMEGYFEYFASKSRWVIHVYPCLSMCIIFIVSFPWFSHVPAIFWMYVRCLSIEADCGGERDALQRIRLVGRKSSNPWFFAVTMEEYWTLAGKLEKRMQSWKSWMVVQKSS